jgi:hypothetical protein
MVLIYQVLFPSISTFETLPNGEGTRQTQRAAAEHDVEVITAKQLWPILTAARCTYYDVLALEDRRLASMRELPEALRRTLST